ncbi:MAG TPA: ribonuclease HII [Gaiellales bacterium]
MPRSSGSRLFAHDRKLGARMVAGTDEAGRGCLAGPLVVAAVCLDSSRRCPRDLSDLDDSKRLTEDVRERLFHAIVRRAAAWAVVVVPADAIDRRGLHRSNLRGMATALRALGDVPDVCLSDGFRIGAAAPPHTAITGGDGRSAAIAAASVLAKVTRDRYMRRIAGRYPAYGFERHVGYITPEHTLAVREHGATPLHRRSFQAAAYRDELDVLEAIEALEAVEVPA